MFQKSHEEQSSFERERISQAKLIMKPFILRRVKNEVRCSCVIKKKFTFVFYFSILSKHTCSITITNVVVHYYFLNCGHNVDNLTH